MATDDEILKVFPFDKPRDGQLQAMQKILSAFDQGKKFVILEGPTGCGKSVIAHTVAQFYKNAFYLTSTKILQDQLIDDFGVAPSKAGLITTDLKGRNAYPCLYWDIIKTFADPEGTVNKPPGKINCDSGACKTRGKSRCQPCMMPSIKCPYFIAVDNAQMAHTAIMNFSSFMFQTTFTKQFESRHLLIIDECHNVESQLMNFVSLSLNDALFLPDIKFPELKTTTEYAQWLAKSGIHKSIATKLQLAKLARNIKDIDYWTNTQYKLNTFLEGDPEEWVCSYKEIKGGIARILEFKPIFIREYARRYIFDFGVKVLLMSATVLSPAQMSDSLGIKKEEMFAYQMASRFPVKNRPIYVDDVGSMSYKSKAETMPKLVDKVTELVRKYAGKRGIIHTHNFEIAETLKQLCPRDVTKRFRYQNDYESKNVMLDDHAKIDDSVIIAPAMHEGLDLAADLARFAIICKVPYPSFKDNPQLEARMQISEGYYDWLTSLKIVQSYGRAIRSEDDYADTYIIDSDFIWFSKKAEKLLPKWFKEAIV